MFLCCRRAFVRDTRIDRFALLDIEQATAGQCTASVSETAKAVAFARTAVLPKSAASQDLSIPMIFPFSDLALVIGVSPSGAPCRSATDMNVFTPPSDAGWRLYNVPLAAL